MALPYNFIPPTQFRPATLVVFVNGQPRSVISTAPNYNAVVTALKSGDDAEIIKLLDVRQYVVQYSYGKFQILDDDSMMYDGKKLEEGITKRVVALYKDGLPIDPVLNFLEKLDSNPSPTSKEEVYLFLNHNELPITEDGDFLAYKMIRADYKDCHSGTMDNSVGATVKMARDHVQSSRNVTCSSGLHFCSLHYVENGPMSGKRLVVLKINPANVVSIPYDYNNAKGRACEYLVLSEIERDETLPAYHTGTAKPAQYAEPEVDSTPVAALSPKTVSKSTAQGSLSDKDVKGVYNMIKNGFALTKIAEKYGISPRSVGRMRDNEVVAYENLYNTYKW